MDGDKKERKKYRISLTVFDKETGVRRACAPLRRQKRGTGGTGRR